MDSDTPSSRCVNPVEVNSSSWKSASSNRHRVYSLGSFENFKHTQVLDVKRFYGIVYPSKDYWTDGLQNLTTVPRFHAFRFTRKWTAQLKREIGYKIVTKSADNEKSTIFKCLVQGWNSTSLCSFKLNYVFRSRLWTSTRANRTTTYSSPWSERKSLGTSVTSVV